jgi:hypothetical protein
LFIKKEITEGSGHYYILRIYFVTHIFIGYSTLNVSIYSENRRFNKKLKYTFHKSTPTTQFVQRVQLSSEETVQWHKGGNFNTLSLVDCYVQICNGTAVEHGSLLNCSGVQIFDVIEQRMSEVRKGTSRNTENENKRCKIFNKVLNNSRLMIYIP